MPDPTPPPPSDAGAMTDKPTPKCCGEITSYKGPCSWDSHDAYDRLIGPLRDKARELGYALAVHGTLVRDIDLIAVPWGDAAVEPRVLAEALRDVVEKANGIAHWSWSPSRGPEFTLAGCPGTKPHGRLGWVINLTIEAGPYIDLSVMPPATAECADGAGSMTDDERCEIQAYIDRCMRGEPGAPLGWGLVRRLLHSHAWRCRELGAMRADNDLLRTALDHEKSRAERATTDVETLAIAVHKREEQLFDALAERDTLKAELHDARNERQAAVAERDKLIERAATAEHERDAVIRLHLVKFKDKWGVFGVPNHYIEFFSTETEAFAFVRKAAGLTPAGEEVGGD